ncbi:CotH kinase family protein [Bacterioplanoides sp.]|uniref:CotH kinase family protein n=1 Tax=Bacterioplanoides sp. TaxID=2066072 RepID=UPI003B5CED19
MKKILAISIVALGLAACQESPKERNVERDFDESTFVSSNLPIAIIQTNHLTIPDEPKILTKFTLINSPDGVNKLDDTTNLDYGQDEEHRYAGIEVRGFGSQSFAKQQYSLELWEAEEGTSLAGYAIGTTEDALDADEVLEDQKAELLGMAKEEDWVLYAPYADKSLMRNVLAYDLAADISGLWQPKTEFIEVFFSDENNKLDYRGVYILTEKIKRDSGRIDINKLKDDEIDGEDLTGGYILELTPPHRVKSDEVAFSTRDSKMVIAYPKPKDIQPEQIAYISNYTNQFVDALYGANAEDDTTGYTNFVELDSLVDYFLVHELFKNRDGFYASAYFHKDKNGKLVAGPVWDFNLSSGNDTRAINVNLSPSGWFYRDKWVAERLYHSAKFVSAFKARWSELRKGVLSNDALNQRIDGEFAKLNQGAATRNFQKWDILGKFIQGNQIPDSQSHREEVEYLRDWLLNRLSWIDRNIDKL